MNEQRPEQEESGEERQERLERERHRPEQNRGYDEAVRTPGLPNNHEVPADERPRRDI